MIHNSDKRAQSARRQIIKAKKKSWWGLVLDANYHLGCLLFPSSVHGYKLIYSYKVNNSENTDHSNSSTITEITNEILNKCRKRQTGKKKELKISSEWADLCWNSSSDDDDDFSFSSFQAVHLSGCDVIPPEPTANVAAMVTQGQSQKSYET